MMNSPANLVLVQSFTDPQSSLSTQTYDTVIHLWKMGIRGKTTM